MQNCEPSVRLTCISHVFHVHNIEQNEYFDYIECVSIRHRLGRIINSYINDKVPASRKDSHTQSMDKDYEDAYEELEQFLNNEPEKKTDANHNKRSAPSVPREIAEDLAELGLPPDADENQCKEAYKKLLKIHHPDRHAGHPGNMEKATKKTARINVSYDRLEKWYKLNR